MLQTRAARLGMFLFCASRLRHQYSRNSTSVRYRHDVMSSTREDVIRRRHVLLRCADSSLNHEWSKTASFVSCLHACHDAVGVRPPIEIFAPKRRGTSIGLYGVTSQKTAPPVRTANPTYILSEIRASYGWRIYKIFYALMLNEIPGGYVQLLKCNSVYICSSNSSDLSYSNSGSNIPYRI
jgi:hypothetical protein